MKLLFVVRSILVGLSLFEIFSTIPIDISMQNWNIPRNAWNSLPDYVGS